jgi:RNA polymerase sigma-70 factor, ECF subfamily
VAMVDGPRPALAIIDAVAAGGNLDGYHLLHAARAELLRRTGSPVEAAESYAQALALVTNDSERRFLEKRLQEVIFSCASGRGADRPRRSQPYPT